MSITFDQVKTYENKLSLLGDYLNIPQKEMKHEFAVHWFRQDLRVSDNPSLNYLSTKHENILWYAIDPSNYTFRYEDIDRIPYMAPNLVGPDKAKKGKTPTDSWWHTIVSTNGKEKTGYPTQKPLGIINRIIKVHSNPGDLVLDFFAGSGTTGMSAITNDRNAILIDNNPESIKVMKNRFKNYDFTVENSVISK